jgi:uroporphyrin-III C-methyltransferase / precorrin-2 dehydrogenase / sirohydrochlorin ferrochelatase
MRYYPIFVDLAGQPCVVLGGDRLALEKVEGLLEANATVRVIAKHLSNALESLVASGRVEATRRDYRRGDLAGSRLVIDASGNEEINRLSWEEAEAAGILINVVDRTHRCRFIAPAIVRRDPLFIAISTSGESPFLASVVRARIERWLGSEWGPFTAIVGRLRRALRKRAVPLDEQTRIYRRLLSSRVRPLLRGGKLEEAEEAAVAITRRASGSVALVGAGPGDPALLTVRALELLADADYVLHDALIAPETLALCGSHTRLEDVGKRGGRANPGQELINSRMVDLARAGNLVVRLKGGDPFVFGRGGEELAALVAAGIDVAVVPGVTAALAAPAALGIPVTLRGIASSFAVTTAQGPGAMHRLADLARAADTVIVLMGRELLSEVVARLVPVLGQSRDAALVSSATLPGQRSVSGPLARIPELAEEAGIATPATLVIGDVVGTAAARAELSVAIG